MPECRPRLAPLALVAVAAVLAAETFLVRPRLDARVLDIIAGRSVPASALHNVYVALEVLKLALILVAAVASARWAPAATGAPR